MHKGLRCKNPLKPPLYIGGTKGRLPCLLLQGRGFGRRKEEGVLLQLGFVEDYFLSCPPPFFLFFLFFLFIFALAEIGLLGWPNQPTKGWCATHGPIRSSPGWVAPLGKTPEPIRHSPYFTGNARNLSGCQMQQSYISIFVFGPFRRPS